MNRIPYGYERDFLDWLFPIVMLALFAGLIVTLLWSLRRAPAIEARGAQPKELAPLEQAALRLARGEITIEDFDAIRERIAGDGNGD